MCRLKEKLASPSFYLLLFGFLSLFVGLKMLLLKEGTAAGLGFAGGFMAIILSRKDEYEYFKFMGVEAKLRSKV